MSDYDFKIAMGSEVFRNFAETILKKEAEEIKIAENMEKNAFESFEELQLKINLDEKLRSTFRALKEKFANDPNSTIGVNKNFVEGINLLLIDEDV